MKDSYSSLRILAYCLIVIAVILIITGIGMMLW